MAIITISRGTFSGGESLAKCIAEELGYRCISREVLVNAAKQYGVLEEMLHIALVEKPVVLERMTLERIHYLAYVRAALLKEAKDENVVYHGHAGHLLLKGVPHVLGVRVNADMEFRIKAAMDRHQLSREGAIQFIAKMDDERTRWTRFLYDVDWSDPSLCDIVVNLDHHISLSSACSLVCHMARMKEYEVTPESKKAIDDLALSAHIRATIAAAEGVSDSDIEVTVDGDAITIGGTMRALEEADKLKTVVGNVSGVKDMNFKMQVRR